MTMHRPRICYANKVSEDLITVATNTAGIGKLVDRNAERRYISTSGDETGTVTITFGSATPIDTLCFLNTNMSNITCTYNSGTEFNPEVKDENASGETINIVDSSNNFLVDSSSNYIVSAGIASAVYNNFYF